MKLWKLGGFTAVIKPGFAVYLNAWWDTSIGALPIGYCLN